ncbi:MAG: helix-turn-helix domain-containing protein [Gammaproteobacteria bacterium]|nr:helix-turn-helix domain-containing protein [Gammaproteobacteria bacterium]MDH5730617.1 helix-turn-helix domain-containing protein [Gammaproteobacteria bacterium]
MPYHHLTEKERYVIEHLIIHGLSYREIGRRLNRHHTTISREVKRNWKGLGRYWHIHTQVEAERTKSRARHWRKLKNKRLYNYVIKRITVGA